MTYDFPV